MESKICDYVGDPFPVWRTFYRTLHAIQRMKPETQKAISILNEAPLLRGGGELDFSNYTVVSSFGEARKFAESRVWERFYNDVANGIFTIPIQRSIRGELGDERAWIKILEANGAALRPACLKIQQVEWSNVTRFPFVSMLADICAELEISHLIKPVFFFPLVFPVLCAGHFPCGWDGDPIPENWSPKGPRDLSPDKLVLPSGRLMVHKIVS